AFGDLDLDRGRVQRVGDVGAQLPVERAGDAVGGLEVGAAQVEADGRRGGEVRGDDLLDGGAVGDAPGGGRVDRDAGAAAALRAHSRDHQVALRQRVDLAVGALERGQQQGAAAQALGVAQRGDGDVDGLAAAVAGREAGADH